MNAPHSYDHASDKRAGTLLHRLLLAPDVQTTPQQAAQQALNRCLTTSARNRQCCATTSLNQDSDPTLCAVDPL